MSDIAKIAFSADTSDLKDAKVAIGALVAPAKEAEKAADKLSDKLDKTAASGGKAATATDKVGHASKKAAKDVNDAANAADRAAAGNNETANAADRAAAGFAHESAAAGAAAGSVRGLGAALGAIPAGQVKAQAAVRGLGAALESVGKSSRLTVNEGLNLSRQFADIGVTAAMGMNPLMIAIQQGPQLLDIFQTAAIRTGQTVGQVARQAGADLLTQLGKFLPLIGRIGLVAGVTAAAFGLLNRSVKDSAGDVTAGMNLTKKELKELEEAGVSTSITLGDTFFATFTVIGRYAAAILKPVTDAIGDWWSDMLDDLSKNTAEEFGFILGVFNGTFRAAVAIWNNFPDVFADIMTMAANAGSSALNNFINNSVSELNFIIRQLNNIHKLTGGVGTVANEITAPGAVFQTNRRTNGAAQNVADEYAAGAAEGPGMANNFFGDITDEARRRRRNAINDALGDRGGNSGRQRKELTDAEKFAEIMKGAAADLARLRGEGNLIGMVGEELARERAELDLLAQAKAKDIELTDDQTAAIKRMAAEIGAQSASNDRRQFMEDFITGGEAIVRQMTEEISYIGMSAEATDRLRIANAALADARAKGIQLSDEEIAMIRQQAAEQAALGEQIRRTQEAFDLAKGATRGFVEDLRQGLMQGQNIFESFGNAVLNVLNKVLDKMLDIAVDSMFSGGGKGSGIGGFLSGLASNLMGGFGGTGQANVKVKAFADGGAFTNDVVSNPTLFKYARGAAMGVMGEDGAEAVMPLKRGPDGALGVQMYNGNGGGRGAINAPITVENHYHLDGAISSRDVIELTKQAAEKTKGEVKRQLSPWLQEIQQNGAVVS